MKRRLGVAVGLAAMMLGVAACSGGGGGTGGDGKKLTIWLQPEAEKNWPKAVQIANDAYKAKHPGANVEIITQQWPQHLTKLNATLAGNAIPDVVELGNTETPGYLPTHALADLTANKSEFPNSETWLDGLSKSCTLDGKLYCVPYYAGSRAIIYRTDYATAAGVTTPPQTLTEFLADAAKVQQAHASDTVFSAVYLPPQYWIAAMTLVNGAGGSIATQASGSWMGGLTSGPSMQGLTTWKSVEDRFYHGDKTKDESDQANVFALGHAWSGLFNGWELPAIIKANPSLQGKLTVIPLPSETAGKPMAGFIGGSNLAIPTKSKNQAAAREWIADFTSADAEQQMISAGQLPNTASLLDKASTTPEATAFAKAATQSWFVPVTKHWPDVENSKLLQQTLVAIASGKTSLEAGAKTMNDGITSTLNQG